TRFSRDWSSDVCSSDLGDFTGALALDVLVHHGHRRFGEDRQRRRDDLEVVAALFLERQEGLVLPRQQHVADLVVDEGDGRATGRSEERRVGKEERWGGE